MTHMYFSARAEGRISYGHLGRTNSCYIIVVIIIHAKIKVTVAGAGRGILWRPPAQLGDASLVYTLMHDAKNEII